jgi:rhodanese-related sulfurtransferase
MMPPTGSLHEELASPAPPLLIDVRTPREWSDAHIDSAVNLPLSRLADRLDELPADRSLVVYCAGGYRSSIAVSLMRREGRRGVANLVGGIGAWESARLATAGA